MANYQPYQSNFQSGTPISQLIEKLGGMLKPQDAFSKTLPYDQFASPYKAVFDQFAKGTMRPQFEYSTLNPWKTNYQSSAASNNSYMLGSAANNYKRDLSGVERGYEDQFSNAQNSYNDMVNQAYMRRVGNYYDSPGAFNNIGIK
jgi:hypothetical protein